MRDNQSRPSDTVIKQVIKNTIEHSRLISTYVMCLLDFSNEIEQLILKHKHTSKNHDNAKVNVLVALKVLISECINFGVSRVKPNVDRYLAVKTDNPSYKHKEYTAGFNFSFSEKNFRFGFSKTCETATFVNRVENFLNSDDGFKSIMGLDQNFGLLVDLASVVTTPPL